MAEVLEIRIANDVGLHARPASLFVRTAAKYSSQITVRNLTTGSSPVNAKSILAVLTLGAVKNTTVAIEAEGDDAPAAIGELKALIESNFGDVG